MEEGSVVPSWTGVAQPLKGTDLRLFPDLVHKPRGDPAAVATVSQGQENQYILIYISIYQYHIIVLYVHHPCGHQGPRTL